MGWIESPGYFCEAPETGHDVGEEYAQSKIGTLPYHKFLEYTTGSPEYKALSNNAADDQPLIFMMEVYVDNYIRAIA